MTDNALMRGMLPPGRKPTWTRLPQMPGNPQLPMPLDAPPPVPQPLYDPTPNTPYTDADHANALLSLGAREAVPGGNYLTSHMMAWREGADDADQRLERLNASDNALFHDYPVHAGLASGAGMVGGAAVTGGVGGAALRGIQGGARAARHLQSLPGMALTGAALEGSDALIDNQGEPLTRTVMGGISGLTAAALMRSAGRWINTPQGAVDAAGRRIERQAVEDIYDVAGDVVYPGRRVNAVAEEYAGRADDIAEASNALYPKASSTPAQSPGLPVSQTPAVPSAGSAPARSPPAQALSSQQPTPRPPQGRSRVPSSRPVGSQASKKLSSDQKRSLKKAYFEAAEQRGSLDIPASELRHRLRVPAEQVEEYTQSLKNLAQSTGHTDVSAAIRALREFEKSGAKFALPAGVAATAGAAGALTDSQPAQAGDFSDFDAAIDQYGRLVIDMDGDGVPDLVIPQNR